MPRVFLTAHWRHLAMVNWRVDPELLAPLVPRGTELDFYRGQTYLSLVGFLFLDTRLLGLPIPAHRCFEEVNLRFYVRRPHEEGDRRGVVFVKELVPRRAVAAVARWVYHENYVALPMRHAVANSVDSGEPATLQYAWMHARRWQYLRLEVEGPLVDAPGDSHEQFIKEHYWGYTRRRNGATSEYRVEHPPWRIRRARRCEISFDAKALYGPRLATVLEAEPASAFLADGSAVQVFRGARIA